MPSALKNRPTGIVILAVLWTLVSIYNIYQGLNNFITDLRLLPYISNPNLPEWFRFGGPAETVLNFFVIALSFLTLLVVYALYTSKSWSYGFALALPILITVINIAFVGLYLSAPLELGLRESGWAVVPLIVANVVALVIVWSYLTSPHVKQYLKQIPSPQPAPMPPPPVAVAPSEGNNSCRYCGAENKTDADFCERCGKKIR